MAFTFLSLNLNTFLIISDSSFSKVPYFVPNSSRDLNSSSVTGTSSLFFILKTQRKTLVETERKPTKGENILVIEYINGAVKIVILSEFFSAMLLGTSSPKTKEK